MENDNKLISDDLYPAKGGDEAVPEESCNEAAASSEVSNFLRKLKSIDKIVIVDDVRKYGPEDIKKLCEELKDDDEET